MSLSNLDIVIVITYMVAVMAIGLFIGRSNKNEDDLFLAGRSLGVTSIGFSLFASNISSTTLIGLAGDAYETGIAVYNYEWMAAIILLVMALFILPILLRNGISTMPEYLQKRFGKFSGRYLSIITIIMSIFVDTAGGIFAGALVLKVFFPDLVLWQTCIALAIFAGIYTAFGGLKAVVFTDVIQSVLLILGSTLLCLNIFNQPGISWQSLVDRLPEGHLSLFLPLENETLPWLGTLLGLPILGFYYWSMNQYIIQRALGAKNINAAQKGALLAGFLKLTPLLIMVLPGSIAYILLPDLPNKDLVFPTLIVQYLPAGVTGIVLSGLLAAIMSSIDSTLNSASTLVTLDFIKPRFKTLEHRQILWLGRICTAVFMTIAAAWAPMIQEFKGLFSYLQMAFSYVVPPLVAAFILGYFSKTTTARAINTSLVGGHLFSLALMLLNIFEVIRLHFTLAAFTIFCFTLLLVLVQNLLTTTRQEGDRAFIFSKRDLNELKSSHRLLASSGVLLVCLTAILLIFGDLK